MNPDHTDNYQLYKVVKNDSSNTWDTRMSLEEAKEYAKSILAPAEECSVSISRQGYKDYDRDFEDYWDNEEFGQFWVNEKGELEHVA